MKQTLPILLLFLLAGGNERLFGQQDGPHQMLRIYEDDDFINIRGQGTDDAYTNGTRIDFFYTKKKTGRKLIDRLLPTAGDSSIDVFGWGAMEVMYTPDNIADPDYQPNDYPWSGGLFATHTLYSYNPRKKYDLQTELVGGIMGPAALGKQLQTSVHRLIKCQLPMGWSHQFRDAPLLNINFTAEKQLAAAGSFLEVIGGAQASAGTMLNGLAVYPLIRIGKMTPYFHGYLGQYSATGTGQNRRRGFQFYFIVRPEAELVITNALLEGGVFTSNPNIAADKSNSKGGSAGGGAAGGTGTAGGNAGTGGNEGAGGSGAGNGGAGGAAQSDQPYHALNPMVYSISYGAVLASGNVSLSFTQNSSTAMMKGLYAHEVGNISLYFSWQ